MIQKPITLSVHERIRDLKQSRDTVMADEVLAPRTKFALDVLFQEMILHLEESVVNERGA